MSGIQQLILVNKSATVAGFRYYRIYITTTNTPSHTAVLLDEFEAKTTPGGADITTPSTTVFASYFDGGQLPSNVVDNTNGTFWSATKALTTSPWWIEIDLVTPVVLAEIALTRVAGSGGFNGAPGNFIIQGSNDRVAYTDLKTVTTTEWTPTTPITFTL